MDFVNKTSLTIISRLPFPNYPYPTLSVYFFFWQDSAVQQKHVTCICFDMKQLINCVNVTNIERTHKVYTVIVSLIHKINSKQYTQLKWKNWQKDTFRNKIDCIEEQGVTTVFNKYLANFQNIILRTPSVQVLNKVNLLPLYLQNMYLSYLSNNTCNLKRLIWFG